MQREITDNPQENFSSPQINNLKTWKFLSFFGKKALQNLSTAPSFTPADGLANLRRPGPVAQVSL